MTVLHLRWAFEGVVWATSAGIAIGVVLDASLGHLAWRIRAKKSRRGLLDDLLGLGLLALVYEVSGLLEAWGFLAVLFAAVALRQVEHRLH